MSFFQNYLFQKNHSVTDQESHSVGPNLGPNCLQRLSADDKSHCRDGSGSVVECLTGD